jgi:prevent-host-death family protein
MTTYREKPESATTGEVRENLADYLGQVHHGKKRVVITRHNRPCGALVPIEDLELLQHIEDSVDLDMARAALAEARQEGTESWESLKVKLGL